MFIEMQRNLSTLSAMIQESMMAVGFTKTNQYKKAKLEEIKVEEYFLNNGWDVEALSFHDEVIEKLGDRLISRDNNKYYIDIKEANRSSKTGNLVIELVYNDVKNKPGWLYTSKSDYIIYTVDKNWYVFELSRLKEIESNFSLKTVKSHPSLNDGYQSICKLLPIELVEKNNLYNYKIKVL